jgi:ribonucleoside-diphosphate reductase alpha chain
LAATNPCAEQPLPPFGACLLGSFNLVKYLDKDEEGKYYFDFEQLYDDIPPIVQGMDNVIDRTKYPLAEQKGEAISKRRMGLGVMGLANALEACGFAYGSKDFITKERQILNFIKNECYNASADLAKIKGAFPLFDAERFLQGEFIKTLPDYILAKIAKNGIRNSHLTSIAPTGTISLCADNVSGGIEPVFAYELQRQINTPEGPTMATVRDYGFAFLNTKGRLAADVTADEHIAVLSAAQENVDSAVSKTVNMDSSMSWESFKQIYYTAWKQGCKGCATFNSDGKRMALLVAQVEKNSEELSCSIPNPETGQVDCG